MKLHLVTISGFAALVVCGTAAPGWASDSDNAREMQITYQLNDSQIGPATSDRTDASRRAGAAETYRSGAQDKKMSSAATVDPKQPQPAPVTQ